MCEGLLLAFLLLAGACRERRADTKPAEAVGKIESAVTSGPNCTAAGDPTLGVDTGFACTGALAAATFTHALCACGTINDSNSLTTDGFDSTLGGPNGGLGADVAANGGISWSTSSTIGGSLWTPGNLSSPNSSTIRSDLHLGGTLTGSGVLTINRDAFVVKTLPTWAHVLGKTTKLSAVAPGCNCASPVPIANITAAHRAPNNDDGLINLSATAYVGNNPTTLDLPCGNYYLTAINASLPLTIKVHGHTALHVDGNLQASQALAVQLDATATLDLFVAGTFSAAQSLSLGSTSLPGHCRMYVAGTSFVTSGTTTIGCNVYAPNAQVTLANNAVVNGSAFAGNVQVSGNATIHYDTSILTAGAECCTVAKCDDGNSCTVDSCNADGTCAHAQAANGSACSDGNACTRSDACQSGACVPGTPVACMPSDQCHLAGTCDTAAGACSNPSKPNGTACSDGNACTQSDSCQAGTCSGTNPVACSVSDQCHVAGSCNATTGLCSNPNKPDGATCNDGNACTQSDSCQAGTCTGAGAVICAASDQCHVAGTCNTATGICSTPNKPNGSACSDGNACTQSDSCQAGTCTGANPRLCSASDQCHIAGTCDAATGICSTPNKPDGAACNDGNACTQSDSCQAGTCTGGSGVVCTASDQCHVAGTCNTATGVCSNPINADGATCNDGNACTQSDSCLAGNCQGAAPVTCNAIDQCHVAGTCDTATGACSTPNKPDGAACNDSNACTRSDSCQAGTCTGASPVVCAPSDQCHLAGSCDVTTGTCSNPPSGDGAPCNDANACTQSETCQSGVCQGGVQTLVDDGNPCTHDACEPLTGVVHVAEIDGSSCADTDSCNGAETCKSGVCASGAPPDLDDNNPCTVDSCSSAEGVLHVPLPRDTSCSNGDACDGAERCDAGGTCVAGVAPPLDDGNPCTVDSCDPATGVRHENRPEGALCDNGNFCDGIATCNDSGQCEAGAPSTVDDGNPCTVDACEPSLGVTHVAVPDGTSCADQDACNGSETCARGACQSGTALALDDGNPCTLDSCRPGEGVVHNVDVGRACPDADRCNGDETCDAGGHCRPGVAPAVDDGNPCTTDSCDVTTGARHVPVAPGTACDDGTLCNGREVCGGEGICQSGAAPAIDDQNPCTADSCDATGGVVHEPLPTGTLCGSGADECGRLRICDGDGFCDTTSPVSLDDGNACTTDTCGDHGPLHTPIALDDGDPCTVDECNPATGVSHRVGPAGVDCSDGNLCNGREVCTESGTCEGAATIIEDDGDPCTRDACDPQTGVPTHSPVSAGDPCIATDLCGPVGVCGAHGECIWSRLAVPVDDHNPCTEDHCNSQTGAVEHTALAAGTACNDDDRCTDVDTCDAHGNCAGVLSAAVVEDDGNPCTTDSCDPVLGAVHTPVPIGTACGDRAFCSAESKCAETLPPGCDFLCLAQNPSPYATNTERKSCVQQCVIDVSGLCAQEGQAYVDCFERHRVDFNGYDEIQAPECAGLLGSLQECRARCKATVGGESVFNFASGPYSPECVTFTCSPEQGLEKHLVAAGTACEPFDTCAAPAECDGNGGCLPTQAFPFDGVCPGVGPGGPDRCDGTRCGPGYAYSPNPCYDAYVDAPRPDGTPCQLGLCADSGSCKLGRCEAAQWPAGSVCDDDADLCTGFGYCDGSTWTCWTGDLHNSAEDLTDNDPCTDDLCDPATEVMTFVRRPVGATCDDRLACNGTDAHCSVDGACVPNIPAPEPIDDGNPCTTDYCSWDDQIQHTSVNNGTSCADADVCNGKEVCQGGNCIAGTAIAVPNDGNPCTVETCHPINGYTVTAAAAGTACANGNLCDGNETCDGMGHCVAGVSPVLSDNNACTVDTCDPAQGTTHVAAWPDDGNPCTDAVSCDPLTGVTYAFKAVGAACSDGNPCNGAEICTLGGVCAGGPAPPTDDGNPCTVDACDPARGVTHIPTPGGTSCSDGNACNGVEICDGGGGCLPGRALVVDDGVACTQDTCEPASGVKHTWGPECAGQRPTWLAHSQSGPSPRDSAAGTFAEVSGELVVIGGDNAGAGLADTWLFDVKTSAWRSSKSPGLPARAGATAAYDRGRKRVVVFGGASGGELSARYLDDVWTFDPVADSWSKLDVSPGPAPRAYAAMAVNEQTGRYVLFGGTGSDNFGDTWELDPDGRQWILRNASSGPSPRGGAMLAYSAATHRFVLQGGGAHQMGVASEPAADTWEYEPILGTWTEVLSAGGLAQTAHSLVYDSKGHQFISFGGTQSSPGNLGGFATMAEAGGDWIQRLATTIGRAGHVSGYDAASGNVLIATGLNYTESGLFTRQGADVWSYDPATNSLHELSPSLAPSFTYRGLVFDAQRQTLVAMGRFSGDSREAMWEIGSDNRWQLKEASLTDGLKPSYQFQALGPQLYDSQRRLSFTLVDGSDGTAPPAVDLMGWDGTSWRKACRSAQIPYFSAPVYDPVHDHILSFGGETHPSLGGLFDANARDQNSVLELDPVTCAVVKTAQNGAPWPAARSRASAAWDMRRSRLIVSGGIARANNSEYLPETWAWDPAGKRWTRLASNGPWPPDPSTHPLIYSRAASLTYDPVADRVLWLGPDGETWLLDLALDTWSRTVSSTGSPLRAAAVFDGHRGNIVALDEQGELWDWLGTAWQHRSVVSAGPSARNGAVAGWAYGGGYAVLFGGVSGDGRRTFLGDTWIWRNGWKLASHPAGNGSSETPSLVVGTAQAFGYSTHSPSPRAGAALAFEQASTADDARGVLFGGEGDDGLLNDTWVLRGGAWGRIAWRYGRLPPPRTSAALAATPDRVGDYLLFGGKGAGQAVFNDTWAGGTRLWTAQLGGQQPGARWGHAMATDFSHGKIILFGGRGAGGETLADTWEWTRSGLWKKLEPRLSPPARFGHSLAYDSVRHRLVLTGGAGQSPGLTFGDTWEFDAESTTWRPRDPETAFAPRAGHASFFDEVQQHTIAFGGLTYHAEGRLVASLGDTLLLVGADATTDTQLQFANGIQCSADTECASGSCVDGVCCNSPCAGQCGACNLPGREGVCSPVKGGVVGARPPCASADECGQCGGTSLLGCGSVDGSPCGGQGCTAGQFQATGSCAALTCTSGSVSCAPYNCSSGGCLSSCKADTDCFSSDYFCTGRAGTCQKHAKITSTRLDPLNPSVGARATLWVTADVPYPLFRYKVEHGNATYYPCGSLFTSEAACQWVVDGPGQVYWEVDVRTNGSRGVDDSEIVTFQVAESSSSGNGGGQ